jgi:hypothetical protein
MTGSSLRSGIRFTCLGILCACLGVAGAASAAEPSTSERAAIFQAAGFKAKGDRYVHCEDDVTASYMPGRIELQDLNGDGKAEAWVKESSLFCYGHTAEFFVLLGKDAGGKWTVLLQEVGVPLVLESRTRGWPDIEVGGPGAGPFPVHRWDGKTYAPKR